MLIEQEPQMTREEIIEYQAKERAFLETPIGRALHQFKLAHSRYWQSDSSDTISDRRLRELSDAAEKAEQVLRDEIERLSKGETPRA
jgi:hypothetical protein